jgi:hypothetical protein
MVKSLQFKQASFLKEKTKLRITTHNKLMILYHLIQMMILMGQNHTIKDRQGNSMPNQIRKSKSPLSNKTNNPCFNREDLMKFPSSLLSRNTTLSTNI